MTSPRPPAGQAPPGRMRRPFAGLRHASPRPRYDAVIIGAGIGGLFTANLLAREGLSVLLVERHYMVGGYCSTFRRRGYTFDAATHFYPLLGNPSTLTGRLLPELGIETGWVKMDPVDTFHFPDGTRFAVPPELDTYLAEVKALFPHQQEALDLFFGAVREAYLLGLLEYFRGRPTARLDPYRALTLGEVLDRHFTDRKLKLLLTADCPHWGSPPCRTSFVFDSMLRLSYFLGNYYPRGGSQAFADELAWRFEERGGHVLMSTAARDITVEEGRVTGVVLETLRGPHQGAVRQVRAETVISNADLALTVEHLLPPGVVDPAWHRRLGELRPSWPCFLSHLGLVGMDPRALAEAQGYYWNGWDPDLVGENGLRCKIFVPTHYEPRMAPPGGQIVILQKVLAQDFDAVTDWAAHKEEIETYITDHLESALPGIREHLVVQTSASALTARRFTGNLGGAMLGWEMSPDQLGEDRPGVEGPVPGLFLVGHWTRPGGGITPVIVSATEVARRVVGSSRPRPSPEVLGRAEATGTETLHRIATGGR